MNDLLVNLPESLKSIRRLYAILTRYSPGEGEFDREMRELIVLVVDDNKACYRKGFSDARQETLRYPTVPMSLSAFLPLDEGDK